VGQFFKTSKAKGHFHIIYVRNPQVETVVDPQTGQPVQRPLPPEVYFSNVKDHVHEVEFLPDGTFSVKIDPHDGHLHESVEPFYPEKKEVKEDELEVAARALQLAKVAFELEVDSREDAQTGYDFYGGDQWDKRDKQKLEKEGRCALTLNDIERHIDELLGYERQQRSSIKYRPVEGGDAVAADLYTEVSKIILENSNFPKERSLVFRDQVIAGRGNFSVTVDFMKDIQGDVKVKRWPWDKIAYGPHEEEDAADAEYFVKFQMASLGRLKKKYKKLKDQLDGAWNKFVGELTKPNESIQHAVDHYGKGEDGSTLLLSLRNGGVPMVDIALKEILVMEIWEKCVEDVTVIADPVDDLYQVAYGWKDAELKQLETIEVLRQVETQREYVRVMKLAGDVLLSDENPADLAAQEFYTTPAYGKKVGPKFWGVVKAAIDPQREINKRASQAIDIGNKMAGYGWFYDDMTFPSKKDEEDFKNNSAKAGFTQKVVALERLPEKVEGTKFPGELVGLMEMSGNRIQAMLSTSATSRAGANTSAQAILQAEKSQLIGREIFFDNLWEAEKRVARLLLGLIRRYYPPERIYRMVSNQAAKSAAAGQPMQLGGQPFDRFSMPQIVEILENAEPEHYDLVADREMWSPTQRVANLTMITGMAEKGAPIPFEFVAEFMDMPEDLKQRMIAGIQQQQAAQQQGESKTSETEIQKALIGQGLFPPKVLQEQGIDPAQVMMAQQPPINPDKDSLRSLS
jgi:hypothetical protein